MFEYKIQEAWRGYKSDFGLSRIGLYISFFNSFLFFYILSTFNLVIYLSLLPVILAMIIYFFRPWLIKQNSTTIFLFNTVPIFITIVLNYALIGLVDKVTGRLPRQDALFAQFDLLVFKIPPALHIEHFLRPLGFLGTLCYDLMISAYFSFFLLPIYGAVLYFFSLPESRRYKMGRYFSSIIIYFTVNYLFYLAIPVTGPQYYMADAFSSSIPFSPYGAFLAGLIRQGQTTLIDCFPSGHSGIAILVCYWLFKFKHQHRFFMAGLTGTIIMATISLRYHYTWDVLAAFPLAYLSFKFAYLLFPVEISAIQFLPAEVKENP